jgi:phage antirepressor YoqD-like protein
MSSREIADLVESRHDNVKRTIERLAERGVIGIPPMEEYPDSIGRRAVEYRIGKRDSYVIVAQLSPEFTARLVDRWQALEEQVSKPPLPDFTNPAIAARAWADEVEKNLALEQKVAEDAPKVRALSRLTESDGSMCITDAAKAMQIQPKRLFDFMSTNQWIYRRPGSGVWTAYQDKLQSHVLEHKIGMVERSDGSEKVTTRVLVTSKGIAELARQLERAA